VAVLAVVANLIVEGKVSVLPAPVVHQEPRPAPVVAPPPAPAPVVEVPAPAPVRPPFPSTEPLQRALDRIDHAVDGSADGDIVELTARYEKLGTELERTAAEFSSGATAAGESPPARFMVTVRAYRQQGADLIELTTTRRKLMAEYSAHFEQLNTRVKKSLDHAWKIFGRVVARQSLVKLTSDLDDLRRRYVEFVSAETVDSSTFDTLGASEGTLAQTLAQDRAGFTSAEGQDWYTKSQADLQSMSDARRTLLKIDRDRKEGARKFSDEAATVVSILGRMGKTETYVARHPISTHATTGTVTNAAASGTATHATTATATHAAADTTTRALASGAGIHAANETATRGATKAASPASAAAALSPVGTPVAPSGTAVLSTGAGRSTNGVAPAGHAEAAARNASAAHNSAKTHRVGTSAAPATPIDANAPGGASSSPGSNAASDRAGISSSGGWDTAMGASPTSAAGSTLLNAGADAPGNASGETVLAPAADGVPADDTVDLQTHERRTLIAWLSGGVLLLVVYISASTALSIVRPVRRLLGASARIAKGESGVTVPRGGIRELDTLALAFNDMAAQLAVAQSAARDQTHLLEAKVTERTFQLQDLAQRDPLTRLANRRQFFTLLETAIEKATGEHRLVGVFFLDVDNFKNMNDSLGHEFGDKVLQTIAARLTDVTRSFGFAARLGGDEFTIVYESASTIEDIRLAGMQLIQAFEEPMPLEGRDLVVSISAGASVYPEHAQNVEALLRAADAALYEAKALGRSQLAIFTPALLEAATERFHTEQGLRRALDRGEFELVFQPEINLQTCEVELVEALLRWRRPDGRIAAPGEFLAVAEASGLILQINDWVLRQVIEIAARWHHGHWPEVRIAINVSPRQMYDNSFVDQIQDLLEQHRLPARCIEIELTENVLQTGSATIASLRRLRAHGIAIALDDFGTGFSSLASLEQLPLTRIKLDRSLIASIDTNARSASIARAIIQLCQGLGLQITAEGIERLEQLAPLVGYPALFAQGYLLARPQSIDDLFAVMSKLPALTRSLVRSSISHLPDAQLVEALPLVTAALNK
jgi:diguanylate cyclase (GGDEF)-like protein